MIEEVSIPGRDGRILCFFISQENGEVKLCRYSSHENVDVFIPNTYLEMPITSISEDCFFNHPEIKRIKFPDTLTIIGPQAFALCKGISELVFPNKVTEIGHHAFRDCTGLRKVVMPPNLKRLETGLFSFCYLPDDVQIVLNEGLEVIESSIFSSGGVNLFFTLTIPNSVKYIATDAFEPGMNIISFHSGK